MPVPRSKGIYFRNHLKNCHLKILIWQRKYWSLYDYVIGYEHHRGKTVITNALVVDWMADICTEPEFKVIVQMYICNTPVFLVWVPHFLSLPLKGRVFLRCLIFVILLPSPHCLPWLTWLYCRLDGFLEDSFGCSHFHLSQSSYRHCLGFLLLGQGRRVPVEPGEAGKHLSSQRRWGGTLCYTVR